jgi:ribosomal protein L31
MGRKKTTEDFIEESTIKHKGYYSYPNADYTGGKYHIEIECPVHGTFSTKASHHLSGIRCRKCSPGNPLGILTRNGAENKKPTWSNIPSWLYFLEIQSYENTFYKVGVTTVKDINNRVKEFPKHFNITVLLTDEQNLYQNVLYESEIKAQFEFCKFKPLENFRGKEECFIENPLNYYYYEQ